MLNVKLEPWPPSPKAPARDLYVGFFYLLSLLTNIAFIAALLNAKKTERKGGERKRVRKAKDEDERRREALSSFTE